MLKTDARTAIEKVFWFFFQKRTAFFRAVPHDGTVTLAEAKIAATAKFDHLDTDKEGTLDAHELTGLLGPKMATAADTDHDKTLDHAEYLDVVAKAFARADADHDGTLDPAELSTPAGRELVAMLAY